MYIPARFRLTDKAAAHRLIQEIGFATLVSSDDAGLPTLSHLPFHLEPEEGPLGTLYAHMARANPQWRHFDRPVAVSFLGPHAYISPAWYESQPNVPTWNYLAAEARGQAEIIAEPAAVRALLERLVATYESDPPAWTMASVPHDFTLRMMQGIVAFRIPIASLEAKSKLGQNKTAADRLGVAAALEARGDTQAHALAQRTRESLT